MILWFIKILRLFFAFLDKIAYTLIALVYELFMLISQAGIFSQAAIQEFATRIYVFLGLIMVFKVSISLVTYILNPDNFSKADVGAPALLKGFAFALFGIVLVPYVFEAAYSLQNIVLKDNLIGNLIMGMSDDNNDSDDYIRDAGLNMSFVSLTAFIRLDTQFPQISETCAANPVEVTPGANADEEATGTLSEECSGLEEVLGNEGVALLTEAYAKRSISRLTDGDLLNVTSKLDDKNEFVMNYLPIVSTAAGVFIAYVILLFCIDIAVRSVKLGFLQLIAPIPLIAKVDPKKGGEKFKKWMEECVSTYLDIFLRLAAIYFVLFIISMITTSGNSGIYNVVTGYGFTGISGIFVKIFIIIGALNFARDLPKLLSKILGVDLKGSGGFTLNPAKKLGGVPILGTQGGNLMRRGLGGLDAMKNGGKFGDGWRKQGASDKGVLADMKKWRDTAMPYSASSRKANQDAIEKARQLEYQKAKGEDIKAAIDGKKNANGVREGSPLEKFKNENAAYLASKNEYEKATMENAFKAEKIFKDNSNLQQAYKEMANAKSARDMATSNYEKAKMAFDRGEGSADDVDKARINSLRASSAYDNQNDAFKTMLAANSAEKDKYDAYTKVDDLEKDISKFVSSLPKASTSQSSGPTVQQTVNYTTGVSRPSATSNGAPTAENSRMAEVAREDDFRNNRS